jgi:hypothetical protein
MSFMDVFFVYLDVWLLVFGSGVNPSERAWSRFRLCHALTAGTAPLEHGAVIGAGTLGIHLSIATLTPHNRAGAEPVQCPSNGPLRAFWAPPKTLSMAHVEPPVNGRARVANPAGFFRSPKAAKIAALP